MFIDEAPLQSATDRILPVKLEDVPAFGDEQHRHGFWLARWNIALEFVAENHLELPPGAEIPYLTRSMKTNNRANEN